MSSKNTKFDWPEESPGYVDFHENVFFIYGIPKIGKTTFASKFSDALFFLTEEGAKHQKIHAWHIEKWTDFLARLGTLKTSVQNGDCPFKTVVIDTVDNLSDYCEQFICDKYSMNTLGDFEYGKGYQYYKKEFTKQVRQITQLGLGLVFVSHADEKEVSITAVTNPYAPMLGDLESGKVRMVVPTLEKRAYKFISAMADLIFYLEINAENQRVINTKPTKHFEAGDRTGRLPEILPLDYEIVLEKYYGAENGEIPSALLDRINKGEQFLAQHRIDNFDQPKRVEASRNKHLGTDKLETAKISQLEAYLQHLRIKAKNNGGKNAVSSNK